MPTDVLDCKLFKWVTICIFNYLNTQVEAIELGYINNLAYSDIGRKEILYILTMILCEWYPM